jgi:tetratricopeptide (TPR) repeat protein
MGRHADAVEAFEKAVRLDPDNLAYKENCAAECLRIDMVHRAEELLGQVEPVRPSASVYALLGNVAVLKGESARAELAFTAGLGLDPDDPELKVSLALLQLERGRYGEGKALLESALAAPPGHPRARQGRERARLALDRLRAEREQRLCCSRCGREWWAPKDLSPQQGFTVRGEPPGEAPAGMCPRCGKTLCVRCASEHVRDQRFRCPECGEPLKLSTDALKWLFARGLEGTGGPSSP